MADTSSSRVQISSALDELGEAVQSTETAAERIMSAAENILCAENHDAESFRALVEQEIGEIFEACSFQDLVGQRITKVQRTFELVNTHINTLEGDLTSYGLDVPEMGEGEWAERDREQILHGPQLTGDGVEQDDIDALMESSQDDIDALFA